MTSCPATRPFPALRASLAMALLASASWAAAGLGAQQVVLRGEADLAMDRRLARLIQEDPLIVTRDTAFAPGDTIRRSVLVLDARLVHEGVVLGDLVMVEARGFIRPRGVVTGDLVNLAGGLYRSELATVGGRIHNLPVAPYRVVREPDQIVILAMGPGPLELDGFRGLHPPTYDRVNGLTLVGGAAYRFPRLGRTQPRLHAQAGWQTQRGDPTYAVDFSLRRGANVLAIGHERAWDTNERWIRGDLLNSLLFLWNGQDLRDYHEVERTWVELSRDFVRHDGRLRATGAVRGQIEDATSLVAGTPWFLIGSETRENPPIDDGRTTSLLAGLDLAWEGRRTRFDGRAEYEGGRSWRDGAFRFDRVRTDGRFAMAAFANHSVAIRYLAQAPLSGDPLPRQRWTFVGGPSTLHTLDVAEFYGDHVIFADTRYIIPLPDRLALPILGAPRLHLLHVAGMAWTSEDVRDLHQELGFELDLSLLYVRFVFVPDDPTTRDLSAGLAWPVGRKFPWER
jgi:hypothetical protein